MRFFQVLVLKMLLLLTRSFVGSRYENDGQDCRVRIADVLSLDIGPSRLRPILCFE